MIKLTSIFDRHHFKNEPAPARFRDSGSKPVQPKGRRLGHLEYYATVRTFRRVNDPAPGNHLAPDKNGAGQFRLEIPSDPCQHHGTVPIQHQKRISPCSAYEQFLIALKQGHDLNR